MNWGEWTPQENVVLSIREVLQEALIPDNEIQKNVQHKLNVFQTIGDFTYYLLYIISNPNYSEEIRSLSGILLKNNINSAHATKMSQDELMRVRQQCLGLLQDPCKDIRSSISNVLVMLAKDNLTAWPELVPLLIDSFDICNEFSEVSLNTLTKICEEIIRNCKSDEEIYAVTTKVFPKLNEMLGQDKCTLHLEIIKLVNQFLQEYFTIIKQSVDLSSFIMNVMKYADSEDVEVQKQISLTFVLYLDNMEESLLPHIHDVIVYLLAKTQHKDSDVALQACEFWITATRLTNCKELLSPYVDKLLPILLKNMKYSEYELTALKDCLGNDAHEKDQAKDIYRYQNKDDGDDCYSEDEENFNDDVDDCYIGWTLRKCSAASLDGIAVRFREELLPLLTPYLNEILLHQDYYIKESAILALGAVAEGCIMGLKPYLPFLINYLVSCMNDEHSVIRVITCWTLGRYVGWIINSDPSPETYFIPVMTVLLKHFVDDNKRVQRAAISAFCIFQETAQTKLIPYIDIILEGFVQGFQMFQYRSLYLLYDAIGALAQSVGNHLSKPEYMEKFVPQLMQRFSQCDNYSDDNFVAVLECLANVIPSLEMSFLPYSEVVYWHCLSIITDTIHSTINYNEFPNDYDVPDKEPMNVAHDVLYSMALGLKNHFVKYVVNSNLLCLLHTTMMDSTALIRQTAIALYGELVTLCFPYLSGTVTEYIPILIKNLDEQHEGVCNNAAWSLGRLGSVMGPNIQPYIPDILPPLLKLLREPNISRPMSQTAAVSFCILCYVSSDMAVPEVDLILTNCCMLIRNLKDSEEKDLAFRGLCKAVVSRPDFFKDNFFYFCDAVASWNNMRLDLKENIKTIFSSFKEQCGEQNWNAFNQQCPEPLKIRLVNLYGI